MPRITEGYIKKTFEPIDKLNKEVTDFIFAKKEDAQKILDKTSQPAETKITNR